MFQNCCQFVVDSRYSSLAEFQSQGQVFHHSEVFVLKPVTLIKLPVSCYVAVEIAVNTLCI